MNRPRYGACRNARLMQLVAQLARELSIAVLFTEHSMDVVFGFARRVLVMSQGRLIADGAPDVVRDDPSSARLSRSRSMNAALELRGVSAYYGRAGAV